MHNDGRLGELQAAAKDLVPVEERERKIGWVCGWGGGWGGGGCVGVCVGVWVGA